MTSRYQEYLQSSKWLEKRDRILKRAKGLCEQCGRCADDVHHKTYERLYCEADDDLIAVCRACHEFLHDRIENMNKRARQDRRIRRHAESKVAKMYR